MSSISLAWFQCNQNNFGKWSTSLLLSDYWGNWCIEVYHSGKSSYLSVNSYSYFRTFFFITCLFSKNKFVYFVSAKALVFLPFYNTDFHEHVLWGYPALLVYSTRYSVQWVVRLLKVYLYSMSHYSHDYRVIFESPFTFMWSLLLNDIFC